MILTPLFWLLGQTDSCYSRYHQHLFNFWCCPTVFQACPGETIIEEVPEHMKKRSPSVKFAVFVEGSWAWNHYWRSPWTYEKRSPSVKFAVFVEGSWAWNHYWRSPWTYEKRSPSVKFAVFVEGSWAWNHYWRSPWTYEKRSPSVKFAVFVEGSWACCSFSTDDTSWVSEYRDHTKPKALRT